MEPKQELAILHQFLKALESGAMTICQSNKDVTQREMDKLKPDIKYLESILDRRSR